MLLAASDRKAACRNILSVFLLTPPVLPFTLAFVIGSVLLPHAGKLVVRLAVLGFQGARQILANYKLVSVRLLKVVKA